MPITDKPTLNEPHPERFSVQAAVNGEYPALCDDPECEPCTASAQAWAAEDAEEEARALAQARESALTEAPWPGYEADAEYPDDFMIIRQLDHGDPGRWWR